MPFMIRTNVIDNCPEKGTFGTETVDYFDNRIDATKAYNQLIVDIRNDYADSANRESMTLVYLYEYQSLDHGDHTNIFITSLINFASISWYNYELFIGVCVSRI